MTMVAGPASAAPDEDFVVGSGAIELGTVVLDIFIDAHSDASGTNPSGTFTMLFTPTGSVVWGGPVTCLEVTGNTATIGFDDARNGHVRIQVMDNSAAGSPDTILGPDTSDPGGEGCPYGGGAATPLASGDFVVHDALVLTAKDQCKDGGWRDFTEDDGQPFETQGQCVAFVEHAP